MSWISLLSGLVILLNRLTDYLGQRQLIRAGEAEAIAAGFAVVLRNIDMARRASDAIEHPASAADDDYALRVRERYRRSDDRLL